MAYRILGKDVFQVRFLVRAPINIVMRPVLILQHQTAEYPAYLATWLDQHRISYEVVDAESGQQFPSSMEPYAALSVLGGGMSANDDLISNRRAEILILQAMLVNKPVIGHCLGGQLMTRALGGTVAQAAVPEIGWQPITYSNHELVAEWFGTEPAVTVAHWHYETFSIPPGAILLASSPVCTNQAWTLGPHLAMQFHIEMDVNKAKSWASDPDPNWAWACEHFDSAQSSAEILAGIDIHIAQHQRMANSIYRQWLSTTEYRQATL